MLLMFEETSKIMIYEHKENIKILTFHESKHRNENFTFVDNFLSELCLQVPWNNNAQVNQERFCQ